MSNTTEKTFREQLQGCLIALAIIGGFILMGLASHYTNDSDDWESTRGERATGLD